MQNDRVQLIAQETRNTSTVRDHLDCEVRFASPEDDGTFEGYAVRFDVVDSYKTTFDRRAFTLDGKTKPLFWNHNAGEVLGSVRSISVDGQGLKIQGRLNLDVARAREVRSMLISGDIAGLSIGFRRLKDEQRAGGVRHITQAELAEVSFVAIPSVPGSGVTSIRTTQTGRDSAAAFIATCQKATRALKGK